MIEPLSQERLDYLKRRFGEKRSLEEGARWISERAAVHDLLAEVERQRGVVENIEDIRWQLRAEAAEQENARLREALSRIVAQTSLAESPESRIARAALRGEA